MFFNYHPPYRSKGDLRFIFAVVLIWLPAFGWMPDNSITFEVMKLSALIIGLLTLYAWIGQLETKSTRAWVYMSILPFTLSLTAFIYLVRFAEFLTLTFLLPFTNAASWVAIVLLVSLPWANKTCRAEQGKLRALRDKRLLEKFEIFNEKDARWKISNYYPGIDGSTPEDQAKKEQQQWGCISLIPISGITFYLIRSTQDSIAWILLFLFLFVYSSFLHIGMKPLAVLLQLRKWENELGRPIYTDIKKGKT